MNIVLTIRLQGNSNQYSTYHGPVAHNLTKLIADVTLIKFLSWRDVKISILKYGKYIEIFLWKNLSIFCIAKATHIFAAKLSMYLKIT